MPQNFEPLPYEPEKFAQKYPDDESLLTAIKAAQEIASKTSPRELDESPTDARQRIDQSFDTLKSKTEEQLEASHKVERAMLKEMFIRQQEAEIKAKHQPGINAERSYNLKIGGQFARDEEVRLFREHIDNNQKLKNELAVLGNKQAERQEAISHAINQVQDDYLREHGLDIIEPQSPAYSKNNTSALDTAPIGSDDFKAALKQEKDEIEKMRRNEMLLPRFANFNR